MNENPKPDPNGCFHCDLMPTIDERIAAGCSHTEMCLRLVESLADVIASVVPADRPRALQQCLETLPQFVAERVANRARATNIKPDTRH